ncbi:hypothetical protein [Salmon gill poxvirus]|uniref:Uncharacterized protein n=1 Tax=Salmon gill poxvirus TaxID=1680908 RepID=A0A0H4Y1I9_9POXV|nr:hypothetical protein AL387_gp158 [Salmon gill poxvirus]AKR04282.1 hypothetical protein SGPV158 [Salmon gill poxvirus]
MIEWLLESKLPSLENSGESHISYDVVPAEIRLYGYELTGNPMDKEMVRRAFEMDERLLLKLSDVPKAKTSVTSYSINFGEGKASLFHMKKLLNKHTRNISGLFELRVIVRLCQMLFDPDIKATQIKTFKVEETDYMMINILRENLTKLQCVGTCLPVSMTSCQGIWSTVKNTATTLEAEARNIKIKMALTSSAEVDRYCMTETHFLRPNRICRM